MEGFANTIAYSQGMQFELVTADSGCDGNVAAAAAQTLVDEGVVGVVGAACSGATMDANAVLSAAGIPMISYASTSPAPKPCILSEVAGDLGSSGGRLKCPSLLYCTEILCSVVCHEA